MVVSSSGILLEGLMKVSFHLDSPFLYRYCDPRGLDILKSLRLKATSPTVFNDPFEFLPHVPMNIPRDEIFRTMTESSLLREIWSETGKPVPFKRFQADYIELLGSKKGSRYLRGTNQALKDIAASQRDGIVQFMATRFGIVCYSEVPDDILMWSHYSSSHSGMVIGFDPKHIFFRKNPIMPVVYQSERVSMQYDMKGLAEPSDTLSLFRTKSTHWSYEKEWRQFFDVEKCFEVLREGGGSTLFHALPPKAISSITLGVRASEQTYQDVEEALTHPRLAHVKMRRARLHDRDFKVQIEELN